MNDEHVALVALLRRQARRTTGVTRLLEAAGSASQALALDLAGDGAQTTLLPEDPGPLLEAAAADVNSWRQRGYTLLSVLDPGYPVNLRSVTDRPPLLFVHGSLTPHDAAAVAIIGTRQATDGGRRIAATFAAALSRAGLTIISGLAAGIDTAAHVATLDAGGRTIAVIGTGLDRAYPPENASLQERIARTGAVISQFSPGTPPDRTTFPRRNALVSGLVLGSVIIEAGPRSGTRIEVRHALAQGRPVFLHERLLEQPWARELAQQPGVRPVSSASDVLDVIGPR